MRVRFTSMATGVVRGQGGIQHVINDTGAAVDTSAPSDGPA